MARNNPVYIENGNRLRKIRGIRTRAGVSRETGIPVSTLCCYERGERNPDQHIREKIAGYYGVRESDIFIYP